MVTSVPKPPIQIHQLSEFKPVSEDHVRKIILSTNSKSCALDPIPTKLLKECLDVLLPHIVKIINLSISSCTVPQGLKKAIVTPLLKKPGLDVDEFKNFRPVSSLPYLSKIMEKCIVTQLDCYMKSNNLVETNQSAYRKNHSTETALLRITNDLLCAMDKSQGSILIMLDQSAAFDTVNQDILMQRFQAQYGITGSAYAWLDSYFRHRTQVVAVSNKSSDPRELVTGFPQGSVLGPFSYPAYTSPLFDIAREHGLGLHMYADDTQLYVSFKPDQVDVNVQSLEECMKEIKKWMAQNHLKLNDSKTEVLVIGTPTVVEKCNVSSIEIGSEKVCPTKSAHNIGVILDSNLNMEEHVQGMTKTCYLQLYRIGQIRPYLTESSTNTLVRSLILSKLDYANSLLYGLPDEKLDKLQLIQNNGARLIKKKRKYEHVTPILIELHWLPVKQRLTYKINVITYKALCSMALVYITELIQRYVPERQELRSASKQLLKRKCSRLKCGGDRAFSVCTPKLWNELPLGLKTSPSLEVFKNNLKTHLFKMAFN